MNNWTLGNTFILTMNEKKTTVRNERARIWTFVLYPESVPANWRDMLNDMHIPWIESPLHDRCVDADGTAKKPHWHIVLYLEGKKNFDQIKEITDKLNAPIPQKVASMIGVVRYMAHMDNPDKVQYPVSEIKAHGGADVARYLAATPTSRYAAVREMTQFIKEYNIYEFCQIFDYAAENRYDDWFPLLCDNSAYIVNQYIKSCRNKHENEKSGKSTEQ